MRRAILVTLAMPLLWAAVMAQDDGTTWNNASLGQITEAVQRRTKKRFLIDEQVNSAFMQKKVRFLSDKAITSPDELFAIYKSILEINGLALIPAGKEGEEIWKITPITVAPRKPAAIAKGGEDPTDAYVTRLFSLKYVSPREAHAALINLANPQAIIMVETAGLLIVTDYDYNIRRFEEIISALDQKKPDIQFEMIQLQNALASDVEQMLNTLAQTLIQRPGGRVPIVPGVQGQEGLKIVADKRTNSILVLAEPVRMEQVKELVARLDQQAPFETSGIYIEHLRHTNAVDISRTLNALYKIAVDEKGIPSGGSSSTRPGQPVGPQPAPGPAPSSTSGSVTGAEPTIVADVRSNSLIIITDRNTYRTLLEITRRLDQVRPQVLITATVVEVRTEGEVDIGVEINRAVDPDGHITSFWRSSFGQSTVVPVGNTVDIVPLDTQGITIAAIKDRIFNIGAMLKARKSKLNVDILDQPEATTSDNGEAEMIVKQQVPVLQTTVTGTGVAQTTFNRFEEATTSLTISPHISEAGYLRLDTTIKIEKFQGTSPDPTIPPPKTTRELKTTSVRVQSGRTIVIGGIVTQDKSESLAGIPYLSDIPILGPLFRREQTSDTRRTLYIFITPYILYDEAGGDLAKLTEQRKVQLETLRKRALEGLTTEGPGEPRPFSTYRFRRASTWDEFIDVPRRREGE